jgi:outer membrane protein TolC
MFRSSTVRQVKCVLLLTALSALGLVTPASAEELDPAVALTGKAGGLTAEQVAKRASATSFSAEQKLHEVQAAAAQLDKSLYDFFPRVTLSASYARLSKVDSSSLGNIVVAPGAAPGALGPGQPLAAAPLQFDSLQNSTSFSSSLSLPLSDYVFRLFQARSGARAQLEGSQFSLDAARRKADYDARALYYDWVKAELNAAVAQQNLDLGNEHLQRVHALAAADSASEADVARVEATVASSELVVTQARNLAALQRERIGVALHDGLKRDFLIGEDFSSTLSPRPELDDISNLTRTALAQRPELKALSRTTLAYKKQADVARSISFPRLDASAQNTYANPNQRYFPQKDEFNHSWQVGVQLSYSPVDTLSGLAQARAASAKAQANEAQRAELSDAVRTEVTDAVLSHRNAQASIACSARRLAAAETSYRARRERFLADKATTVELTEAQTELFSAKLEAVQARVAIRAARARIAYVTGQGR